MKNFKKLTSILLSLILTISSVSYIYADEEETSDSDVEKQETVYAFLDEEGNFKSATVSEWLHSDNGFNNVKDESILDDIKNIKGDEEIVKEGNTLTWNSSNSDIYYQGTTTKALPISMKISYYFNGQKVNINDVVGQSGKLEIHIKLINNEEKTEVIDGRTRHISTLFPCIILTDLKTDVFNDVKAENAIMVNESKNQVLSFVTVSGASKLLNDSSISELDEVKDKLKDEFVISADVTNLEMPSIYCAISGLVDLDKDNINTSDIDKLKDGINDLESAMKEILDGSSDLKEAVNGDLSSGVDSLNDGANDLHTGIKSLDDGIDSLKAGANTMQEGLDTLNSNSSTLVNGSASVKAALSQIQTALSSVNVTTESLATLVNGSASFKAGLQSVGDGVSQLNSSVSYDAFKAALNAKGLDVDTLSAGNKDMITYLSGQVESLSATLEAGGLDEATSGQINAQIELYTKMLTLLNGSEGVISGTKTYIDTVQAGVNQLNVGVNGDGTESNPGLVTSYKQIDGGINTIASSLSSMGASLTTLKDAIDTLNTKYAELDDGIVNYTNGVNKLDEGFKQIVEGVNTLSSGSKQLVDGSDALALGTSSLKDGVNDLKDGVNKLDDGLNEFNNEGIKELSDKVNIAIDNLDSVVDVVDKLLDESNQYNNYAGGDSSMETSVKFIMKTDEVSIKEEETTNEETTVEVKEESTSFWQRLVNLFKKTA